MCACAVTTCVEWKYLHDGNGNIYTMEVEGQWKLSAMEVEGRWKCKRDGSGGSMEVEARL